MINLSCTFNPDIEAAMKKIPNSCGGSCKCENTGYTKLTAVGQRLNFNTHDDDSNYGANERCYWAIYAPGATRLRIHITESDTYDGNDRLLVRTGTSTSSPHMLTIWGARQNNHWTYITQFFVLQWETNYNQHKKGIHGYIEYFA